MLDFNLYLSPHDAWVGQVIPVGAGAGLITNDNSCTVPKIPNKDALAFSTQAFDGSTVQGKDGGPTDASRTREGYIEVIEMGTVTNPGQNTLDAITHSDGVPVNCGQLIAAWASGGYWTSNPGVDIGPPDGGLTGTGTLINVPLGTVESYNPDAVAQFYPTGTNGTHTAPDSLTPNIASATSLTSMTYPGDVPVRSTFTRGVDAVSSVFMADQLYNEYWTSATIAAASEWVVTYPTKPFYTDPYYVGRAPQMPFDVAFGSATAFGPFAASSCSPVSMLLYNREEGASEGNTGFDVPPVEPGLCFTSQIVTFNQGSQGFLSTPSPILASGFTFTLPTPGENGWATFDLAIGSPTHVLKSSAEGNVFLGQPAAGFWVTQFVNGNVGGVLANYTALYKHKSHAACLTNPLAGQSGLLTGSACS